MRLMPESWLNKLMVNDDFQLLMYLYGQPFLELRISIYHQSDCLSLNQLYRATMSSYMGYIPHFGTAIQSF